MLARLMVLVSLSLTLPAHADSVCGTKVTPQDIARIKKLPSVSFANKQVHIPSGQPAVPTKTSDNFVVHWGASEVLNEEDADLILKSAEDALVEFKNLGLADIFTGNQFYINIIVVPDAEAIDGAAGIASVDQDGFPFMAVDHSLIASRPGYMEHAVAHETMHLVQFSSPAIRTLNESNWWLLEATAETATAAVYPNDKFYYFFSGAMSLRSWLPIGTLDRESTEPERVLAYGGGLFFQHIIENYNHPILLDRMWNGFDPGNGIRIFEKALPSGVELGEVFRTFAARYVHSDFKNEDALIFSKETMAVRYPEVTNMQLAAGPLAENDSLSETVYAPRPMGSRLIDCEIGQSPRVYKITWDELKNQSQATLVVKTSQGIEYLPFVQSVGSSMEIGYTPTADVEQLTISAAGFSEFVDGPLSFTVESREVQPKSDDSPLVVGGGGCSTNGPVRSLLLILLLTIGGKIRYVNA